MTDIEKIENVFIPLSDGTRLAARFWLPQHNARPAPAILEYIPYRKRDATRWRDEPMHQYFAEHGFAAIRVDMRGSGDSDGLLDDEYLKQEQDDALEIIAWIARQDWCDGGVAIIGKSWGGFNALQIAARRPPALKAIIPVCFTDDRYSDDVHYMGGCLLNDNLWWGGTMLVFQSRPPDPRIVGEGWRDQWRERLEHMPFWPALWAKHQHRDAYWKHGSVCEDWSQIEVPTLAVGGWADSYTNAVPRLLAHLKAPALGIIGPWAHIYPQDGSPGPAIGFLQEVVRFLNHWMKQRENGVMDEPKLRAFIEDWSPPATWRNPAPGRWVGEAHWPSSRIEPRIFHLSREGLKDSPHESAELRFRAKHYTGAGSGEWMGTGVPGEAPADQGFDDGMSLCMDSHPLAARLELLGAPEIEIDIASDQPVAQLCARLMAVAPDGSSRRLSYGVLNLTHRDSHEHPAPLEPGRFYSVRLKLNDCGCAIPAGWRVRLALSTAYWPLMWPAPGAATLTLRTGASSLALPVRPPHPEDTAVVFDAPECAPRTPITVVRGGNSSREFHLDLIKDSARYSVIGEGGVFGEGVLRLDETGTSIGHDCTREYTISGNDPLSARYRVVQRYEMEWPGTSAVIINEVEMTSTATHFLLTGRLEVLENGATFVTRVFNESIERDLV